MTESFYPEDISHLRRSTPSPCRGLALAGSQKGTDVRYKTNSLILKKIFLSRLLGASMISIGNKNEELPMTEKTIDSFFGKIQDHRHHNRLHKLIDVIIIAI
ncbi:MAG: transposase family protein, partial [Desulfobacteraceae bacterium]|nr:transposase family protein [Desulfobacteraceae bacterium]